MSTLLAPRTLFPSFFDDDSFAFPTRLFDRPFFREAATVPAVNIKDQPDAFELEISVPGYKKEDLSVDVENGVLTISSQRSKGSEEEKGGYTRREFSYSSFARAFQLPPNTNAEAVKATHSDGILRISIPKSKALPEKKAKEVRIA